jgi:serine/threonine protein kinase
MILKAGDALANGSLILGKPLAPKNQIQLWVAQSIQPDSPPTEVLLRLILREHLQDAKLHLSLINELERLATLQHPTLYLPVQYGVWDDYFYLVTPFFSGHTLRQIMFSHLAQFDLPIPWHHAARILSSLCDALHHAYSKNEKRSAYADPSEIFLHGNLTPEHIGIDKDGNICLLDFGVAKIFRPRYETENGLLEGHPTYLSPEQVTTHERSTASEMFALGTILYEMCVGQPPYPRVSLVETLRAIQIEPPPPMISEKQAIPVLLQEIALCLLEKHPDDRFNSPAALQRALLRVLEEEAPTHNTQTLAQWVQRIQISEDPFHKDNELDLDEASQFFDDQVPNSHGVLKIKIEGLADDQTRPFNPALDAYAAAGASLLSPTQLPNAFDDDATIAKNAPKDDITAVHLPDLPVAFDDDDDAQMNVLFLDENTSRFSPLFTPEPGTLPQILSSNSTPIPPSHENNSPIQPAINEATSAEIDIFLSQTPPPSVPKTMPNAEILHAQRAPHTPAPQPLDSTDVQTQPGVPHPQPPNPFLPDPDFSTDAEISTVKPLSSELQDILAAPTSSPNLDDTLSTPPSRSPSPLVLSLAIGLLLATLLVLAWSLGWLPR